MSKRVGKSEYTTAMTVAKVGRRTEGARLETASSVIYV